MASGYTGCCEIGFCGGYPANCFCDANCYFRGDCCNDINSTCDVIQTGSCVDAGYDTCCNDGFCAGVPEDAGCFCDVICLDFGDCCDDFEDICPGMHTYMYYVTYMYTIHRYIHAYMCVLYSSLYVYIGGVPPGSNGTI